MKYVILVSLAFMLGAAAVNRRDDPHRAMPLVCKWDPGDPPNRCWDGSSFRYMMKGYKVFAMEGGTYLVGWPK